MAFSGDALCELAAQLLALAEKRAATVPLMLGHRVMAVAAASTGNIAESLTHWDCVLALYKQEREPLGLPWGDSKVSALCYRSLALWFLGYPDAALAEAAQAVRYAHETGQAAALMYTLHHVGLNQSFCGNHTTATMQFDELLATADKTGSIFWKATGKAAHGWALAAAGKASEATDLITDGIHVGAIDRDDRVDVVVLDILGPRLCRTWAIR